MGISGHPDRLLHLDTVQQENIPVIQRFSGGGTVIVDEDTLFATLIMNKHHLAIAPFPEPILRWTESLYVAAWQIPGFQLKENDYCIGEKKCGGNAQYITKDRWLHHTSFLWDFKNENMQHLRLPSKRPKYRQDRPHADFLIPLKHLGPTPDTLVRQLKTALEHHFSVEPCDPPLWQNLPHRKSTRLLDLP